MDFGLRFIFCASTSTSAHQCPLLSVNVQFCPSNNVFLLKRSCFNGIFEKVGAIATLTSYFLLSLQME